jgi:hypothetical protein
VQQAVRIAVDTAAVRVPSVLGNDVFDFREADAGRTRAPRPRCRAIGCRSAFAPTAFGLAFAVRPDGRALLVGREKPPAIDLVLTPRVAR